MGYSGNPMVGSDQSLKAMVVEVNALFIRLYLDEDVYKDLAPALRARGFEAISVHELKRTGYSDAEQLAYAVSQQCALFSFNSPDYVALHVDYLASGREHYGIILSKQRPLGQVLRRLLDLLNRVTADTAVNQLWWI